MSDTVISNTLVELTVEDCMDLYERGGYRAVCNDGKLDGFVRDNDQAETLEFIWLNQSR